MTIEIEFELIIVKTSIKHKNKLFKKCVTTRNDNVGLKYKQYRAVYKKVVLAAEKKYYT